MQKRRFILILLIASTLSCSDDKIKATKNNTTSFFPNNGTSGGTNNGNTNNGTNNGSNNTTTPIVETTNQVDILWIIDNSGSMCQEQDLLQQQFNLFVNGLSSNDKDFHIAVTTTHMRENYSPEPVAKPGHIQSTPQPVPGFDRTCLLRVDETGKPIEDDYQPLKNAINDAVNCMETPDESFNRITKADLECALSGQGCVIAGVCGESDRCSLKSLFPPASSYRKIAKVLKSADYQKNGALDLQRLKDDFACMSFVGTRGYGVEKGLSAMLLATSIEKTGGSVEEPKNDAAPNHGFLRKKAKFAAVFMTDENDCSHNGEIEEDGKCGDATCSFANIEGEEENSALLKIADIKAELIANLKASKGRPNLDEKDIYLASIQGEPMRFEGIVPTTCEMELYVQPTCVNRSGSAYSGDRYTRFLQSFPDSQIYPKSSDAMQGWLCIEDFSPALTEIGELFSR